MRSDIIQIDNRGGGFEDAVNETRKAAEYSDIDAKQSVQLQLITEEMLSLARSVTGEMQASFWLEGENGKFVMHMSTKTVMDREKRYLLISSATSRKNEAAKGFLGKLRDKFEEAMASDAEREYSDLPAELRADLSGPLADPEWDGYERSVLRRLADDIKISIKGGLVEMTVTKDFCA
ncbi:MAG: hypothetical protein IKT23_02450 [Clostridia bacterium]|nr:hypothetical protein [Clostridia bacterium]